MSTSRASDGRCQNKSFPFPGDEIVPRRGGDEGKQPAVERSERKRSVEVIPEQNAGNGSEQKWRDVPMV